MVCRLQVEKHIRKRKLKMTFIEQVGRSQDAAADEVASKNEAKKLAFYLFWNMKPVFSRWASRAGRSWCQAGCLGWAVGFCFMGGKKGGVSWRASHLSR